MAPHPEGGWYVQTFCAPATVGQRPTVTAIYFLLEQGQRSHWHTVDATEIWLWHAGAPLRLHLSQNGREIEMIVLGDRMEAGEQLQGIVAEGVWQAAESTGPWSLVSCVVAPGFNFAGFTLAAPDWSPEWSPGSGSL